MVPVARCGEMTTSLWDKQSLRKEKKGQLLINVYSSPRTPKGVVWRLHHTSPQRLLEEVGFTERLSELLSFNGLAVMDHNKYYL